MGAVRFGRIEALVGVSTEASVLTLDQIRSFVTEGVPEYSDLEFKKELWKPDDEGRAELAKDVAALANAHGGLIVVGVTTTRDVATALVAFAVDDGSLRTIRQIVASRVFPLPSFEREIVADGELGYVVVAVPPSPLAPHAVVGPKGHLLSFPVRDGTRTRWLSESELAERYRRRFREGSEMRERPAEVETGALQHLEHGHAYLSAGRVW